MKKILSLWIALVFTYPILLAQNEKILGDWHGVGDINGVKLRITFHINEENDSLIATMDSPDQNVFGTATDTVTFLNNELVIKINNIQLTYQGRLKDTNEIEGRILQKGILNIPVTLGRKPLEATKPERPQEPRPPFDYQMVEVSFKNPAGGHKLAGTLTIPDTTRQYPAVILISGSGPFLKSKCWV